MSRSVVSRRSALLTAFAGAAAVPIPGALALTAASIAPAAALPRLTTTAGLDIRALSGQWHRAVKHEMNIEVWPGEPGHEAYQAAVAISEDLSDRIEALAHARLAAPVRSFDDLVALAEIALYYRPHHRAHFMPQPDVDDLALSRIANTLLVLAGRLPSLPVHDFRESDDE